MHKVRYLVFIVVWLCFADKVFPDGIKTIDGDVIEGTVVNVDEECLSIRQGLDNIIFIEWRIISLISRDKEIIMVNHDGNQKRFSVLTTTENSLSVKNINLTTTDEISSIYPKEIINNRPFFVSEPVQSIQGEAKDTREKKDMTQKNDVQRNKSWKGNVDAGLTVQKGNREAFTISSKMGFSKETLRDNFYTNALFLLTTIDGEKSADEQRGTLKYERKHFKKLYSFYQESLERDEIEKLNLRSISSLGLGYRFIETDALKYKSEIGPSFTYERFRGDILQTSTGLRLGNYLDWQIFPSTKFYAKLDFLPVPEDLSDWRLESDMGIRHNINKSLSLNMSWINDYDNKPSVESVSKNDATILSTIGYNF